MNNPVWFSVLLSVLALTAPVSTALGVPTVVVGTHNLEPNTPDQMVEIHVSGGDQVQGLVFYIVVANGGPELEELGELPPGTGILGPAITDYDVLTGTIFDGNNTGPRKDPNLDLRQIGIDGTTTGSGFVSADGLLARVWLDTTGFFDGTFALSLTLLGAPSSFADVPIDITDGMIVIESDEPPPAFNLPPAVDAGPDQTVSGGAAVQLAGSGSDPEGLPLTYEWNQLSGLEVVLDGASSATASFIAPSGVETSLTFELSVSDGVHTVADAVTISVIPTVELFTIDAGPDQTVQGAATVQLTGTVVHPQALPVTYRWRQIGGPAVVLSNSSSATTTFTAPSNIVNSSLTFELSVSDGVNTATDTVTITVNANPVLFTVDAGADQSVAAGAAVQLEATVSNANPQVLSFEWIQVGGPTVTLSGRSTATAAFTAPVGVTNTQLTFEIRAFDGVYEAVDTVTINVNANIEHPAADAGEDQAVAAGETVQLNGSGTDPAGLGLSFLWVQIDGPVEVQLSSETIADPTFVAPTLDTPSRLEFELRVSSGELVSIDTLLIHVAAVPQPEPPIETPQQPGPQDEETNYPSPLPVQQTANQFPNWTTNTAMAIGFALLIIALLLLWLFLF